MDEKMLAEARRLLEQDYASYETPNSVAGIKLALRKERDEKEFCGCRLCSAVIAKVLEAEFVLEQALLAVPESCEYDVAAAIYKYHQMQISAFPYIIRAGMERISMIVEDAVARKALREAINAKDLHELN